VLPEQDGSYLDAAPGRRFEQSSPRGYTHETLGKLLNTQGYSSTAPVAIESKLIM
jgi:hypothetical protein